MLTNDTQRVNAAIAQPPQAAYVHIPFCRRRCFYCDFPITVVGDKPPLGGERINGRNSGTITRYVEQLCQEIRQTAKLCLEQPPLTTIFFGGGTPSLLSVEQLRQILATLEQQFGIAAGAEISMEMDPATFDQTQADGYHAAGVNRVSLGVQAFQTELLQQCGRSHTVADIYTAIEQLRQAGFTNLSLDLISGLPNQTLEDWQASLAAAIALRPTHISCYDLTIEPGTPFSRHYKPGLAPLPSDELTADMYRTAQRQLTAAGYEHYEISNYAQVGYQCQHNRVYWKNRPFYGFGMGATSYVRGVRHARPRKTADYYDWVAQCSGSGPAAPNPATATEQLLDTLMVGLRLAEGIDWADLRQTFELEALQQVWDCLRPYFRQGWLEWVAPTEPTETEQDVPVSGHLRLTDPEGFLFSNVVLVRLFEALDADRGDG